MTSHDGEDDWLSGGKGNKVGSVWLESLRFGGGESPWAPIRKRSSRCAAEGEEEESFCFMWQLSWASHFPDNTNINLKIGQSQVKLRKQCGGGEQLSSSSCSLTKEEEASAAKDEKKLPKKMNAKIDLRRESWARIQKESFIKTRQGRGGGGSGVSQRRRRTRTKQEQVKRGRGQWTNKRCSSSSSLILSTFGWKWWEIN